MQAVPDAGSGSDPAGEPHQQPVLAVAPDETHASSSCRPSSRRSTRRSELIQGGGTEMAVSRGNRTNGTIEPAPLTIRSEREPQELYVVELHGELDLSAADRLEAELQRVEETDVKQIVVDLSGLDFIDSSGIRVLA